LIQLLLTMRLTKAQTQNEKNFHTVIPREIVDRLHIQKGHLLMWEIVDNSLDVEENTISIKIVRVN